MNKLIGLIWAERKFWLPPIVLAFLAALALLLYAQQSQLQPFIYPS